MKNKKRYLLASISGIACLGLGIGLSTYFIVKKNFPNSINKLDNEGTKFKRTTFMLIQFGLPDEIEKAKNLIDEQKSQILIKNKNKIFINGDDINDSQIQFANSVIEIEQKDQSQWIVINFKVDNKDKQIYLTNKQLSIKLNSKYFDIRELSQDLHKKTNKQAISLITNEFIFSAKELLFINAEKLDKEDFKNFQTIISSLTSIKISISIFDQSYEFEITNFAPVVELVNKEFKISSLVSNHDIDLSILTPNQALSYINKEFIYNNKNVLFKPETIKYFELDEINNFNVKLTQNSLTNHSLDISMDTKGYLLEFKLTNFALEIALKSNLFFSKDLNLSEFSYIDAMPMINKGFIFLNKEIIFNNTKHLNLNDIKNVVVNVDKFNNTILDVVCIIKDQFFKFKIIDLMPIPTLKSSIEAIECGFSNLYADEAIKIINQEWLNSQVDILFDNGKFVDKSKLEFIKAQKEFNLDFAQEEDSIRVFIKYNGEEQSILITYFNFHIKPTI